MEQSCKTCVFITFRETYDNVGRCGKWTRIVNLSSIEKCHTSKKEKPKHTIQNTQFELFNNN